MPRSIPRTNYPSRPRQRIRNSSYLGQSDNKHASLVGRFAAEEAENCDYEYNTDTRSTILQKRLGTTEVGTRAASTEEGLGLAEYAYFASGTVTRKLLAVFNYSTAARIYSLNGSNTWVHEASSANPTADALMTMQNANNAMYFYNGKDDVQKLSNTTWSVLASGAPFSGAGDRAKGAVWHNNINWLWGTENHPSRLYMSDVGAPETVTKYQPINIEDGGVLNGAARLGERLVAFKTKSINSVYGDDPDTVQVVTNVHDVGCLAHMSIAEGKYRGGSPVLYFVGNGDKGTVGVFVFDGSKAKNIASEKIQEELAGINKSRISQAVGFWDGKNYRLAMSHESSTYNNKEYVYYPEIDQWVVNTGRSIGAYGMYHEGNEVATIHYADSQNVGKVFKIDSGNDDDGTNIAFRWRGRAEDAGEPFQRKKFKKAKFKTNSIGEATVDIKVSVDDGGFTAHEALDLSGGSTYGSFDWGDGTLYSSGGAIIHDRSLSVKPGYAIQVEFSSDHNVGQEKIYMHSIFYKPKRIK